MTKIASLFLLSLICSPAIWAQTPENNRESNEAYKKGDAKENRARALEALTWIKKVIEERYYDKNYHGVDIDARFKRAEEKIKTLESNGQIFYVMAALLLEFKDSHTTFIPPGRANKVEYGFTMQMVGNKCYVANVKKGSDAEKQGLKPGDVLLGIGPYEITRESLWVINYFIYRLSPQEQLKLFVADADQGHRELIIKSSFESPEDRKKEAEKQKDEKKKNEKPSDPYRCQEINSELIACRLESFSVEKKFIDKMMSEVQPYKKMILDLRGNGGGYVRTLQYLIGHFFTREIMIGTQVTRNRKTKVVADPVEDKNFKGELLVLTDSRSSSASEVFARVVQLERRGKVVGDVTAGAVMTSIGIGYGAGAQGMLTVKFSVFGLSVTVADLIMSDGNRLEKVGVIPDYLFGPTGKAYLEKLDPVLSHAANLFGVKLDSVEAGKFNFFIKKEKEGVDEPQEEEQTDEEKKDKDKKIARSSFPAKHPEPRQ